MKPGIAWYQLPSGARKRFVPTKQLLAWGAIIPEVVPLREHRKFRFIADIIRGADPLETDLYRSLAGEGRRSHRNIGGYGERRKVKVSTEEHFLLYVDRVKKLIDYVDKHGVRPVLEMSPDDPNVASGHEGDIGLAIAGGEIMLFKKGKHRLAAALALGVEQVPCQCHFVAADALGRLSGADCSDTTEGQLRDLACAYLDGLGSVDHAAPTAGPAA